ncbi:hypothetical protein [Frankia sp. R82]|uniref:hypothetical protein n=1 Tax=Frankia sp. R82 TaxID=2950553 RepID=UPI0020449C0D|nr:hypothetical protein [Frankia sp. R82]MCM3883598.1 hypothetical protein [Frankia sp. R82]
MSTTLKDRISHVTDTAPVSGISDAARHAADTAGTAAHRAASITGGTASTAASATRDAGLSVAHLVSDASGSAARSGAAAGRTAGKAAGKAVKASGRAGRKVEKARSRAELTAERARATAEIRAERQRSRRAVAAETKARVEADKAQQILEKRLAKVETKLARVHRHRRRGVLTLALLGAGAAGTVAARRYLAQRGSEALGTEAEPIPAPLATPATSSSTSGTSGTSTSGTSPLTAGTFDDRLRASSSSLEEMPGVDTSRSEISRPGPR